MNFSLEMIFSAKQVDLYLTATRNFDTFIYIYANISKENIVISYDIFFVVFYTELQTF